MNRAARGPSPSAARTSATRLYRLASETNASDHRCLRSSVFETASGRRSSRSAKSWNALGDSCIALPCRRSWRLLRSNSNSPKTNRTEALKSEFYENFVRTLISSGPIFAQGGPYDPITNAGRGISTPACSWGRAAEDDLARRRRITAAGSRRLTKGHSHGVRSLPCDRRSGLDCMCRRCARGPRDRRT
jgi:hypothetical protein